MSTPNFKTQSLFDLYVTDNFVVYPYELDENDEYDTPFDIEFDEDITAQYYLRSDNL